jgi:PHD/YefM family antitoxin component YafN of YafNO toxin-antitoxin module
VRRPAVILPLGEFEELMEDLEDLAAIAERRHEPTTSHEDFVAELKRDGVL